MITANVAYILANDSSLMAIHSGDVCAGSARQVWEPPYQSVWLISMMAEMYRLNKPTCRIQINSIAATHEGAHQLGILTVNALDGFNGLVNEILIEQIALLDLNVNFDKETDLYNCQTDFYVTYNL